MRDSIATVEVWGVDVPLIGSGFRNAYSIRRSQRSAVVRLTTSQGQVGLGNIDPSPGYSAETIDESLRMLRDVFAPQIVGVDAGNPHRLLAMLDATPGYLDAKAAIDMATVDLWCRSHDVAVHEYLGGAVVDVLRFNAWIGVVAPQDAAREAHECQAKGFRSAKIKAEGRLASDIARVCAVREAVGSAMTLRVDANASFDVDDAISFGRALEPLGVQLLEQPVEKHDLRGMARVRSAIGVPVMADESVTDHASLIEVIRAQSADLVKLKVMKQGGLLNARRMLATAEAAGLKVVVGHGFGLGINTLADIMLASTSNAVLDGLECIGPLKTADDVVVAKLNLSEGRIDLPNGPGLGAKLDNAKVEKYRV